MAERARARRFDPELQVCSFGMAFRHLTRDAGSSALCGLNHVRAGRVASLLPLASPVTCPKCAREAVARGLVG